MEEKICRECGTVNEPDYLYCKNCGTALTKNANTVNENTENSNFSHHEKSYNSNFSHENSYKSNFGIPQEPQNVPTGNPYCVVDNIEGVPMEEVSIYVGKNAHKICPKFEKMEFSGSKTSWCWPAAVLGFLMGPFGSALWFFYRKMYKIALIFAAVGVLVSALASITTTDSVSKYAQKFLYSESISAFIEDYSKSEANEAKTENDVKTLLSGWLNDISRIGSTIIAGILGYYWYKKKVIRDIKYYKSNAIDSRYYKIGLSAVGGTSGGMLALGIGIIIANGVISSIIQVALSIGG